MRYMWKDAFMKVYGKSYSEMIAEFLEIRERGDIF